MGRVLACNAKLRVLAERAGHVDDRAVFEINVLRDFLRAAGIDVIADVNRAADVEGAAVVDINACAVRLGTVAADLAAVHIKGAAVSHTNRAAEGGADIVEAGDIDVTEVQRTVNGDGGAVIDLRTVLINIYDDVSLALVVDDRER